MNIENINNGATTMLQERQIKNRYGYNEKPTTLVKRINAHKNYAKYEINDWILKMINLGAEERVLDVGCGYGKQAIEYAKIVGRDGIVFGVDISEDMLAEAWKKAEEEKVTIQLIKYDANNVPFDFFDDDYFSFVSCCFAIYYLEDINTFLLEVKRILRNKGKLLIVGPTVNNAKEMKQLHYKITNKEIPQIYENSEKRMQQEAIPYAKRYFKNVKVNLFNNMIVFPTPAAFIDYYKSTQLFKETVNNENEDFHIKMVKDEVERVIIQNGKFELHKQVYGIIGYK